MALVITSSHCRKDRQGEQIKIKDCKFYKTNQFIQWQQLPFKS